jgi:F-type H+-transporting ATPase subunit delta
MITAKRVDIRYATALLQTAREQGLEKEVYHDMFELRVLFLNHTDFRNFLRNPAIKPSQKGKILHELFKNTFHKLSLDFLLLVLKKSRINNVQGIVTAYVQLYRKEYHLKTVTVFTAKDLLDEQKNSLHAALTKQFVDQTVELRYRVRPELIGGLVLRYDDNIYDNCILSKLEKFRREFEFNSYESQL